MANSYKIENVKKILEFTLAKSNISGCFKTLDGNFDSKPSMTGGTGSDIPFEKIISLKWRMFRMQNFPQLNDLLRNTHFG